MTITPAQIQDRLAKLLALDGDIRPLIATLRQDVAIQGVWIESTKLTADQIRVLAMENTLLTKVKNDATALQ